MKREQIDITLSGVTSWERSNDVIKDDFVECMDRCQYGLDALEHAWNWFLIGYHKGAEENA